MFTKLRTMVLVGSLGAALWAGGASEARAQVVVATPGLGLSLGSPVGAYGYPGYGYGYPGAYGYGYGGAPGMLYGGPRVYGGGYYNRGYGYGGFRPAYGYRGGGYRGGYGGRRR